MDAKQLINLHHSGSSQKIQLLHHAISIAVNTLTTEMQHEYTLSQDDARQDWHIFASELAAGAVSPPADLLRSVGQAAGGLPKGVSPTKALKASAELLIESGVIDE